MKEEKDEETWWDEKESWNFGKVKGWTQYLMEWFLFFFVENVERENRERKMVKETIEMINDYFLKYWYRYWRISIAGGQQGYRNGQ